MKTSLLKTQVGGIITRTQSQHMDEGIIIKVSRNRWVGKYKQ